MHGALRLLLRCWLLLSTAAGRRAPTPSMSIATRENARYGLVAEFFGERLGADGEPRDAMLVTDVVIRERASGRTARFKPTDEETLRSSFAYFPEVWSPDGLYLVLPLGRWEGFAFFSAKSAVADVQANRPIQTIRVQLPGLSASPLWHEFSAWKTPHRLQFGAGMSSTLVEFTFDPDSAVTTAAFKGAASFEAVTRNGVAQVQVAR
jgi:hypothetical protein